MQIPTLLAALLLASTATAASDDFTVVSKHTVNGKPADTTTSYLGSDHLRMASTGGHETIIDVKTGLMTVLDTKKKTYYAVTLEDREHLKVLMAERMNSPEMKKGMALIQGMTSEAETTFEVKKTGETRTIAGFRCEEWTIKMSAASTMKECVTNDLHYSAHALDAYKKLGESMRESMGGLVAAKSAEGLAEKMKSIKGFPIATSTTFNAGATTFTSESEAIEVLRGAIPASAWETPAGFAKIENPMVKALERHRPPGSGH